MSITLKELASHAGVSFQTVSDVLNKSPHRKVSQATRQRIEKLAREFQYQPSRLAKGLRKQRSYSIGVAMPAPHNPSYATMVHRLQSGLRAQGYSAIFSFWEKIDTIRDSFAPLQHHGCDSLIAWQWHDQVPRLDMPVVMYGQDVPELDSVLIDHRQVIRDTFDHLQALGHKHIGYLGYQGSHQAQWLMQLLQEHGLPANPHWFIDQVGTIQGGTLAMKQLLQNKRLPTAILTLNDTMAYAAINVAMRAGLRVPQDLTVIGQDDDEESSLRLPALTTFDYPHQALADHLIRLAIRRVRQPQAPRERVIVTAPMILRDSSQPPAAPLPDPAVKPKRSRRPVESSR